MIRPFSIEGTVTGFNDGRVTLSGIFDWRFDSQNQRIFAHEARSFVLSRDEYLANTGVLYRFYYEVDDLTQQGVLINRVGGSDQLQDTIHLVVRLMSKHNDNRGRVNTEVARAVLREPGNAYFVPPLPV